MQAKPRNPISAPLREEVLACKEIPDFERLVSTNSDRIDEIAKILSEEDRHARDCFIRPDDPAFTALMLKFPMEFRDKIRASIIRTMESAFRCSDLRKLRHLLWKNRGLIPTIAAHFFQGKDQFPPLFSAFSDPIFFEVLSLFPPAFQEEVDQEMQRQNSEKPHAYDVDKELAQIIQEHAISIQNPQKNCTQAQDPVFINLTAISASAEPSHFLRRAIDKIKIDPRFQLSAKGRPLNAAGLALVSYAKKRLARIELGYCHQTSSFAQLVKDFKLQLPLLAAAIREDISFFVQRILKIDDPEFLALLKQFPQDFLLEIHREFKQRYEGKSDAFHFDDELRAIVQNRAISLINPFKDSTQAQDPVFFPLTSVSQNADTTIFLEQSLRAIKKDPRFHETGYLLQRLNPAGKELMAYVQKRILDQTLRKKLQACKKAQQFAAVVAEHQDHITEITAILLESTIPARLNFQLYFINKDDPDFFELLNQFPSKALHDEVNRHLLRWFKDKGHAFNFDEDLKKIIHDHKIPLINPYKDCTQAQDPIFTYLINSQYEEKTQQSLKNLRLAIKNIKNDPRFTHPTSDRLNDAGRAVSFYAKKRLAELEAKTPSFSNTIRAIAHHIKLAYLAVYGFDGYDVTKHKVTSTQGTKPYEGVLLPILLAIATFLGLPTRVSHLERHDSALPDSQGQYQRKPNYSPNLSLLQILRNLIGGWIPIRVDGRWEWTEKKRWQVLALPVKIGIILPLKLALIPFKLALNIVKLFTELLPALAVDASKMAYEGLHELARWVYAREEIGLFKLIPAMLIGLLALAVRVVFIALNLIKKLGIALTSPEKSAKMAFVYGRKFVLGSKKNGSSDDLAFALGVFLGFISILASAIMWAIFLPVALNALLAYVPAVLQALTWVIHFPVVSSLLNAMSSALMTLGTFIGTSTTLGGAITTLSSFIGLQISSVFILLCSTFALLAAPISSILSRIADDLSNAWARWDSPNGLLTSLCSYSLHRSNKLSLDQIPLLSHEGGTPPDSLTSIQRGIVPSRSAKQQAEDFQASLRAARSNGTTITKHALNQASDTDASFPRPVVLQNGRPKEIPAEAITSGFLNV